MAVTNQPGTGDWRHGLFDCCDSCTDCLLAYFCPHCYAFCAARSADRGICCSVLNCVFFPTLLCCLRGHARDQKGIDGGCCRDLIVSLLCPCCGTIQIKREFD